MGKRCCAVGCSRTFERGGTPFYRFPAKDKHLRKRWIQAVKRDTSAGKPWEPGKYSWLCAHHFIGGKKSADPSHIDYVPTVFNHRKRMAVDPVGRYNRRKRRELSQNVADSPSNDADPRGAISNEDCIEEDPIEEENVEELKNKIQTLMFESPKHLTEGSSKTYTGMPLCVTMSVFEELCSVIHDELIHCQKMNRWQQYIIFMMKLQLNLTFADIGFRFGIHKTTVHRIFDKWLNASYSRFEWLIKWPSPDEVSLTLPTCFRKKFSKCACIIDCSEIEIQRPTDLSAQGSTYSNYKSRNTAKILIAITPQGTICYVSCCWGGRASDNFITEHEALLSLLEPGQVVLADRGFTLDVSQHLVANEIVTPAFARGKKQMKPIDIEKSRDIARVRVHVERVIGLVKNKFSILQGPIPYQHVKRHQPVDSDNSIVIVDKIVKVCCAFANLVESIVPFH